MNEPHKIMGTAEVAKLLGWPTQRARRWLLRVGAGDMRAGRVVTTPGRLETSGIPKFIGTTTVAKLLGWPTHRARRWLLKTGAGEKRSGRVVTTLTKLVNHFPEAFQEVMADVDE